MQRLAELMQVRLHRPDSGNLLAGPQIVGRLGNIDRDGVGYYVAIMGITRKKLNIRLRLLRTFMELRQEGHAEAVLFMAAAPTPEQAVTLRRVLRVKKRRHVSDQERERLAAMCARFHKGRGHGATGRELSGISAQVAEVVVAKRFS